MEQHYTIWLALLDFVPNLGFLAGAIFLVRWARPTVTQWVLIVLIVGSALVFAGGISQALWKLIITLKGPDLRYLSNLQFILMAPGFSLMFLGVMVKVKAGKSKTLTGVPAMAVWKVPLLVIMTISSLGLHLSLSVHSFQRKLILPGACFVISVLIMLGMAGMATGEQNISQQWVEEIVNSIGQLLFAGGSYLLYEND